MGGKGRNHIQRKKRKGIRAKARFRGFGKSRGERGGGLREMQHKIDIEVEERERQRYRLTTIDHRSVDSL